VSDRALLAEVLAFELRADERDAFEDMADALARAERATLSEKQRAWALAVRARFVPDYENLVSSGKAPRGREVPTPAVLQRLPLRPPGRS
jgi:hypothetical protein